MANRGGVDLGGTKIQTVIVDAEHEVLGEARRPTPTTGGPADVKDAIAAALVEAADAAKTKTSSLSGIGVGSPGEVDPLTGAVAQARNLPGWEDTYPLAEALSEVCGAPVAVGNDVQVATNAEFELGAGRDYRSILGVFWGTGVGGGIVLDGKPWLGRGAAGEIGHVVVRLNGARCPCGRRGCMEAYAGRAAMEAKARRDVARGRKTDLFKIMEKRGRERLTSSVWERAIKKGDQLAEQLIERAIAHLGPGIASTCNILDVECVVIGGGLGVRFGERYLEDIRAAMMPHLFASDHPPDVRVAALGDLGGAIGAALLVPAGRRARPVAQAASGDGAGG